VLHARRVGDAAQHELDSELLRCGEG
jgi:hypothetical protein